MCTCSSSGSALSKSSVNRPSAGTTETPSKAATVGGPWVCGRAGICTCSIEEGPDPRGTMTILSWPSSDAWNCWPGPTPAGTVTAKVCIIGLVEDARDRGRAYRRAGLANLCEGCSSGRQ
eukprot:scaffold130188_cov63-Phaeocystis_antarctica.AAC.5